MTMQKAALKFFNGYGNGTVMGTQR